MNNSAHPKNHANCIESVPIFSSLSPEEMREIAFITTPKRYNKGEMVYLSGDNGGKLYVLHTGKVKIFRLSAAGKEQVIRVLGPGEFMGELSLFGSLPQTDNAQALEPASMCLIEGGKLKELMARYTSIAFKVMDVLSRRLDTAEHLIEAISLDSVEQRLAKTLLALSGSDDEVELKTTKGNLASQLGMSQETLSRKLALLKSEGLIDLIGQKRIRLLDREALEEIGEGMP